MSRAVRCALAIAMVALATPPAARAAAAEDRAGTAVARGQVYVGAVLGTNAYIALVVRGSRVTGYLCDGRKLSAWFRRSSAGLVSRDGRLLGRLSGVRGRVRGEIAVSGVARKFTARPARRRAGLYRAVVAKRKVAAEAGWIVLANGTQRGVLKRSTLEAVDRSTAPTLTPTASRISLGTSLGVVSVLQIISPTPTTTATLSPKSMAFDGTAVGAQSAPRTVILTATGDARVRIARISVTNSDFVVTGGTCQPGAVVLPLERCSTTVAFTPRGLGSRSATLVFTDDAGGANRVALSGEGLRAGSQPPRQPLLSIAPAGVRFATTTAGSQSASQELTLTASGNTSITILGVSIVGANPDDFVLTSSTCVPPHELAVGASCKVGIAFLPRTSDGERTAVLRLEDTAFGSPHLVRLDGTAAR